MMHVLSVGHHKVQKKLNDIDVTKRQQARMQATSAATIKGEEVVSRIQNYVAQNVAARSLPFTAGEMALDCVSASVRTIVGEKPLSDEAVKLLSKEGLVHDAAALHRLKYVAGTRNKAGPASPKSPDVNAASPPRKRVRVQLRRNSVKRRIKVLGDKVVELKLEFLRKCPFIALIIDEGNNWSKACPLYVAVLACSSTFEWKIMFIGQVCNV